jgi:hypothetical protein
MAGKGTSMTKITLIDISGKTYSRSLCSIGCAGKEPAARAFVLIGNLL